MFMVPVSRVPGVKVPGIKVPMRQVPGYLKSLLSFSFYLLSSRYLFTVALLYLLLQSNSPFYRLVTSHLVTIDMTWCDEEESRDNTGHHTS